MKQVLLRPVRLLNRALLHAASRLLPGAAREEWRREWLAELWQVERAPAGAAPGSWPDWLASTAFCLGAFRDARDLRRSAPAPGSRWAGVDRSAWGCLLGLTAVLMACCVAQCFLPGAVAAWHSERCRVNPDLILIRDADAPGDWSATVPVSLYRSWKASRQRGMDGFAFYRVQPERLGNGSAQPVPVAHASANLFVLLGLNLGQGEPVGGAWPAGTRPQVVLSDEAWRNDFGGDPLLVGREVQVGAHRVRVAAIAPAGAWRLPGAPRAWLLEPDTALEANGRGWVVAHLTRSGLAEMWNGRVPITCWDAAGIAQDFWGVSFDERTQGPWGIFFLTVLLAFLALPALTSVSLEEVQFHLDPTSWERIFLRRAFLAAKIVLVLAVACVASLDLAYGKSTGYRPGAASLQFLISLAICLFGLLWAVVDQQRRCPVCLKKVVHPARVGLASRTFLAWNGTELMCTGGHTLLHVPGLPTSWFNTPRWVYLDASWRFLFVE
jgi:hypothetical protein